MKYIKTCPVCASMRPDGAEAHTVEICFRAAIRRVRFVLDSAPVGHRLPAVENELDRIESELNERSGK